MIWAKWFSWLSLTAGISDSTSNVSASGWILMGVLVSVLFLRPGVEAARLALLRARGIPLLGLGQFNDPTGRLPGLAHQVATNMNDAGLTFYDERGAVLPDFNFIGEIGLPQAKLLVKLLELIYSRQVQRINVDVSLNDGLLNASVSLSNTANGYVRYLRVVSVNPTDYPGAGELTKVVAQLVADATLIALSRDANTRGLLFQRMGDWSSALSEFIAAAGETKSAGLSASSYQAHLNLGNLYSFLGLQEKSVAAYNEVAAKTENPTTLALIRAALACSYKNWERTSPPAEQSTHEGLARQAMEQALASPARTPLIAYTFACYYSLADEMPECLRWLREAVSGDLAYLNYARTDPDMANLRRWLATRSLEDALGLRTCGRPFQSQPVRA